MNTFDAVGIAEGWIEASSSEEQVQAWQLLHDTGIGYQLQGFFGRTLTSLLE